MQGSGGLTPAAKPAASATLSGGGTTTRNSRVSHDIAQDFENPTIYPSGGSNSGVSETMPEAGNDSRDVDASLTYSSTDPEIYKTFGTLLLKDANDIDLAEWMIYTKMTVILVARFWPNRGVNLRATVYETLPEREPPEVEVLVQEPCKKNPMRINQWTTEILISQDPTADLNHSTPSANAASSSGGPAVPRNLGTAAGTAPGDGSAVPRNWGTTPAHPGTARGSQG